VPAQSIRPAPPDVPASVGDKHHKVEVGEEDSGRCRSGKRSGRLYSFLGPLRAVPHVSRQSAPRRAASAMCFPELMVRALYKDRANVLGHSWACGVSDLPAQGFPATQAILPVLVPDGSIGRAQKCRGGSCCSSTFHCRKSQPVRTPVSRQDFSTWTTLSHCLKSTPFTGGRWCLRRRHKCLRPSETAVDPVPAARAPLLNLFQSLNPPEPSVL